MAKKYKNIPVDERTYRIVELLADANERGLGAQIKVMVKPEYERLLAAKLVAPVDEEMPTGEQEFRAELRG